MDYAIFFFNDLLKIFALVIPVLISVAMI
ncbi:MAG: hypothetical protein RIT11_794, partial [Pseudomonadota bacterium]